MANQSPMISIPRKGTDEVDWTTPIRSLIAQSYGESPDNYAQECAALQRCRQDAVRGAGSDTTARDLLYKYFGQLELLELRFSEIKVNFTWRDAFTSKPITQTSIAYEKASILFQIAATHSAIAAAQSRSDPEGLKRSFYYFRSCAGMLTYINENFLHAPSTDLSREVVKFLVNVILAQATEVFFEKCTDEQKGAGLVAKIASQAASMFNGLGEDVKEFMGKGIFDRNWVSLIQIKAKYFSSLAQYHRGLADDAAGKHGEALVRFTLSESLSKEAHKLSTAFSLVFSSTISPTLPVDAGTTILERTKAHSVICIDKKAEAARENDLIYNAILPAPEALPAIDKLVVATPVHIHEVYGAPDVQKTIGPDIFLRLIPLSVHESASVYSEEKAKLVRGEVENADTAEIQARTALESLGIKTGLGRFKAMAEGELNADEEVPSEVRRWKDDISVIEDREGVETLMQSLHKLKSAVHADLEGIQRDLDGESRECEVLRVKYDHLWTQAPSSGLTKPIRQDLKSHFGALEAAGASDAQVQTLWESIKSDIALLRGDRHRLEQIFRDQGGENPESLLDLDVGSEAEEAKERNKIRGYVKEIEDRMKRINLISRERNEVLKDFKEKVQGDDVSHLLLLNKRNTGVEPALFAAELEKFKPYQSRLAATVHHQDIAIQELSAFWKQLKDLAGRGAGARKWEERERRKSETVRRFSRARDVYMEVHDGLAKGLQFYRELTELTKSLKDNARSFLNERKRERDALVSKLELERKLSGAAAASPPPPPPAKPPRPPGSLDGAFGALNISSPGALPTPPPPPQQQPQQPSWQSWQPPGQGQGQGYSGGSQSGLPPPPPPPPSSQYASQYQPQSQHQYSTPPPPPPPANQYSTQPPPPQQQQQQGGFLPPPPPPRQSSLASPPAAPAADPYASLAMFGSAFSATPSAPPSQSQPQTQYSQQPSQPQYGSPGQSQPQYGQQQQPSQPQYGQGQYSQSPPPPPPPGQVHSPPPPQQQQYGQYGGGFPPPPPPPSGQQGGGYGYQQQPPPPPPPPGQQGGYGYPGSQPQQPQYTGQQPQQQQQQGQQYPGQYGGYRQYGGYQQ